LKSERPSDGAFGVPCNTFAVIGIASHACPIDVFSEGTGNGALSVINDRRS